MEGIEVVKGTRRYPEGWTCVKREHTETDEYRHISWKRRELVLTTTHGEEEKEWTCSISFQFFFDHFVRICSISQKFMKRRISFETDHGLSSFIVEAQYDEVNCHLTDVFKCPCTKSWHGSEGSLIYSLCFHVLILNVMILEANWFSTLSLSHITRRTLVIPSCYDVMVHTEIVESSEG